MKVGSITALSGAEICHEATKGGRMKVGQSVSNGALPSASAVQHGAPQEHDGNDAHPRVAGAGKRTPMVGKEGAAMTEHDEYQDVCLTLDAAAKTSLEIDTAKYQAYFDNPSLSDAQKEEIMQALWSIIVAFVDLGFGVHPAQEVWKTPAVA